MSAQPQSMKNVMSYATPRPQLTSARVHVLNAKSPEKSPLDGTRSGRRARIWPNQDAACSHG